MKRKENKASVRVVFDDGSTMTWSVKPGSRCALDRNVLAAELTKFFASIALPAAPSAEREP